MLFGTHVEHSHSRDIDQGFMPNAPRQLQENRAETRRFWQTRLLYKRDLTHPINAIRIVHGRKVNPFLFVDMGYGRDNAAHQTTALASTGAGVEVRLTRYVSLNVNAARSPRQSPISPATF
jgi:hypothetical protein